MEKIACALMRDMHKLPLNDQSTKKKNKTVRENNKDSTVTLIM